MVVLGGSWVKSAARTGGAALLAAATVVGCGSRTSVLDLDAYVEDGPNGLGGTSSKGGTNSKGGTGSAGGKPTPTAGAPSTTPNTPATAPCREYCRGYAVTCAQEIEDDNCQALCESEINATEGACRKLGIQAVQCLTPYFRVGSGSCDAATNRGLVDCGATLAKFKACSGISMPPTPTPDPPKAAEPYSCANMGAISPSSCKVTFACSGGLYDVVCDASPGTMASHCYCYRGDQGTMFDVPGTDGSNACFNAFQYCP